MKCREGLADDRGDSGMTETHAEKAQRLVDEGRVLIRAHSNLFVDATVREENDDYHTIYFARGDFSCNCSWVGCYPNSTDLCTHALAVQMLAEKERVK